MRGDPGTAKLSRNFADVRYSWEEGRPSELPPSNLIIWPDNWKKMGRHGGCPSQTSIPFVIINRRQARSHGCPRTKSSCRRSIPSNNKFYRWSSGDQVRPRRRLGPEASNPSSLPIAKADRLSGPQRVHTTERHSDQKRQPFALGRCAQANPGTKREPNAKLRTPSSFKGTFRTAHLG